MANPTITTEPAAEPVTLTEAKAQLRIDFSTDDTLITSRLLTARRRLENYCNLWFVERTGDYALDRFPCGRELPLPGGLLKTVTSVTYYDTAGTPTVWDSANYQVRTKNEPGAVVLAYGISWPSTTLRPAEGVIVRFTAGFGAAAAVPEDIKNAILLYTTYLYTNRGDSDQPIPQAVKDILWPYRMVPCRKVAS